MNKIELTLEKVNNLIAKEAKFDFPQFLTEIRKCYGLTRRTASKEMKYPELKLFHLETGTFRNRIGFEEIQPIADYYNIDSVLLHQKADDFITEGKGIPQNYKNKSSIKAKKVQCNASKGKSCQKAR